MNTVTESQIENMTLADVLRTLGYTHRRGHALYAKEIIRAEDVYFVGTAHEVWRWLRETGRITP